MFINELINAIDSLKEFIILTVVSTLFFSLLLFYIISKFDLNKKCGIEGLFFNLSKLSIYRISFFFLYFLFIVSCAIRYQSLEFTHIFLYLLLTLINLCLNIKSKFVIYIGINHVLHGASLIVINILCNYIKNVRFEFSFFIVYLIGSIVLIIYSFYVLLNEFEFVSKRRKEEWKIKLTIKRRKLQTTDN